VLGSFGSIEGLSVELAEGRCQATGEALSPSEFVEYSFAEEPEAWLAARCSREALASLASSGLEAWQRQLLDTPCEEFRRKLLHAGPVTNIYDSNIFPCGSEDRSKYWAWDSDTGGCHQVPHPVARLRVWDPEALAYEELNPQLEGVPPAGEPRAAWWGGLLGRLRERLGEAKVDALLAKPPEEDAPVLPSAKGGGKGGTQKEVASIASLVAAAVPPVGGAEAAEESSPGGLTSPGSASSREMRLSQKKKTNRACC